MRISDWSSDGCSSDLAGTMVEAVAPYRMGVAEPAHREDRSRRDQRQAAAAAEVGVEPRDAPRAGGPLDGKGRAVEMLFGPSLACDVADDHGTPVPGMAVAVVVAVEEQRAIGEVARRPQPEELVEIAPRRRLRLARADRADAPAPVAGARPEIGRASCRERVCQYV